MTRRASIFDSDFLSRKEQRDYIKTWQRSPTGRLMIEIDENYKTYVVGKLTNSGSQWRRELLEDLCTIVSLRGVPLPMEVKGFVI